MSGHLIATSSNPSVHSIDRAGRDDALRRPPTDRPGDVNLAAAESLADKAHRRWARRAWYGDLVVAMVAGAVAYLVRFGLDDATLRVGSSSVSYGVVGAILVALWPVLLGANGAYDQRVAWFGVEEIRRIVRAGVSLLALLGFLHFAAELDFARGYIAAFVPGVLAGCAGWRLALRARTDSEHRVGIGRHRAVAVGPAHELGDLVTRLGHRPGPIEIMAVVIDDLDEDDPTPPVLANLTRLPNRDAIADLVADGVQLDLLLRAGPPNPDELWVLARRAHELDCGLAMAPSRSDASNVAFSYVPLGSAPLLLVDTPALKRPHRVAKWLLDRVLGAAILVALAPVFAAIALVILVRDGRPIIFRQERVGRNGTRFKVFKFRTMVCDAEDRLEEVLDLNEAGGPLFKVRNDPRVTPTGRFLRKHSLDELPQLFNVLTGDMSLVGPRPPLPHEVARYDERTTRRLVVKPGLTGLWQVEGRSDLPWDEGVYLDLLYIDHWSPLLDLVIVARTVRAVFRPRGAY